MASAQKIKEENMCDISTMSSTIAKEIDKAIVQAPCHGEVNIKLIFRDSHVSRWVLTREESRRVC